MRRPKRARKQHDINKLGQFFPAFINSLHVVALPKFVEALSHHGWKAAMEDEIAAFIDRRT